MAKLDFFGKNIIFTKISDKKNNNKSDFEFDQIVFFFIDWMFHFLCVCVCVFYDFLAQLELKAFVFLCEINDNLQDLLTALVALGLNTMEQEVVDMTNEVARNGLIYFPEFCSVVLRKYREDDEEQFAQVMFKVTDNGSITA